MSSFFQSKVLPAVLLGVIAWLALRFLLPLCLPLLLGMGLALAAEPLVSVCSRRLKLPFSLFFSTFFVFISIVLKREDFSSRPIHRSKTGCSCSPRKAASMVSGIFRKSAINEHGF